MLVLPQNPMAGSATKQAIAVMILSLTAAQLYQILEHQLEILKLACMAANGGKLNPKLI